MQVECKHGLNLGEKFHLAACSEAKERRLGHEIAALVELGQASNQGLEMIELLGGGGVARYRVLRSGVIFAVLTGVITMESLNVMHAKRQRQAPGLPAASVCDFRGALLAFCSADLDDWLRDQGSALRYVPSAVVVTDEQADVFLRHAGNMASKGINRQVFLDLQQALGWAEAHAVRRQWTSLRDLRTAR